MIDIPLIHQRFTIRNTNSHVGLKRIQIGIPEGIHDLGWFID